MDCLNMKAFTYLIVNKITNQWYYGVRYAIGCKHSDMLHSYFTSSKYVKQDIQSLGLDNFQCTIRKSFDSVELAKKWESTVLRRMKVRTNDMSYNKHHRMGFVVLLGKENPSKRLDVRAKLSASALQRKKPSKDTIDRISYTKISNNIVKAIVAGLKHKNPLNKQYRKYAEFLKIHKPHCVTMIKLLEDTASIIDNIIPIKKQRKLPFLAADVLDTRSKKVSMALSGMLYYKNQDGTEVRRFKRTSDVPKDWVRGISPDTIEKIRLSSTGRCHTDESKERMREICKKKMYYTNPELDQVKAFTDILDVPTGWIKGNKLTSRNAKISLYLKTVRYKHES